MAGGRALLRSLRLGSIEGQYQLGMLYAFGKGVPESRALAAALFSQAASQGHAEAGKIPDDIQMTVRRVIGLYGGVSHGFDEDLTAAPPWLQALGR